jgi:hypothetical protein
MRRTTTKTTKDQKTSSRASAGEGRDHVHVSSACLYAEQEDEGQKTAYRPRYPRQGGVQLSPCLHKAEQWLLATPLKIAWTLQGARGGRQLPPPTLVDRRHYSTKGQPRKNKVYSCPPSLAMCGNPFPKKIRGRRTLAL